MNKKVFLTFFIAVILLVTLVAGVNADTSGMVSFATPFSNVDDTSGWSTDDSMVNLGTNHITILDNNGNVNAYENGDDGILTQRGTRGLGIAGGEDDEIDSIDHEESIVIILDEPYYLHYIEVRSLFIGEEGDIEYYLDGDFIDSEHMIGTESMGGGNDGDWSETYSNPLIVDEIKFYHADEEDSSTFAVAKLDLELAPDTDITYITDSDKITDPHYCEAWNNLFVTWTDYDNTIVTHGISSDAGLGDSNILNAQYGWDMSILLWDKTDPDDHHFDEITETWHTQQQQPNAFTPGHHRVCGRAIDSTKNEENPGDGAPSQTVWDLPDDDCCDVCVDIDLPPVTEKEVGYDETPVYGEGDFFITDETLFDLDCEDMCEIDDEHYEIPGSGCDETWYNIKYCNGYVDCCEETTEGTWGGLEEYEGPFYLGDLDGYYCLEWYSIDNAENEEIHHLQDHKLDNLPPITEKWYGDPALFTWREIQGINMWIPYIASQTSIFLDATDEEVGVESTWWTLFIPDGEWDHHEMYLDGHWYEPHHKEFEQCLIDNECEVWEDCIEECNITFWMNKFWYMEEFCETELWPDEETGYLWCLYEEPINIYQDCDHKICYFSEDYLENREDYNCQVFSVDNIAPVIEITQPGSEDERILGCGSNLVSVEAEIFDEKSGINASTVYAQLWRVGEGGELLESVLMTYHAGTDTWRADLNHWGYFAEDEYYIKVVADDYVGNSGESDEEEVILAYDVYFKWQENSLTFVKGETAQMDVHVNLCHGGTSVGMKMTKLCGHNWLNPRLIYDDGETEHTLWVHQVGYLKFLAYTIFGYGDWEFMYLGGEFVEADLTLEMDIPENLTVGDALECLYLYYKFGAAFEEDTALIDPWYPWHGIGRFEVSNHDGDPGTITFSKDSGFIPPMLWCGDGECNNGEDCSTCAEDCGCGSGLVCSSGECVAQSSGSGSGGGGGGGGGGSYKKNDESIPIVTEPTFSDEFTDTEEETQGNVGITGNIIGFLKDNSKLILPIIAGVLAALIIATLIVGVVKKKKVNNKKTEK